jgi:hypothetical protein
VILVHRTAVPTWLTRSDRSITLLTSDEVTKNGFSRHFLDLFSDGDSGEIHDLV